MTRAEIETQILAWMRSAEREAAWPDRDEDRFERLALALYRTQYEACHPYAALCRSLDRTPDRVVRADQIPAVPSGAFKEFDLSCFPVERAVKTFRTSGTTSERAGRLYLDRLDLYETSLLTSLRRSFLTDLTGRGVAMRFLAPSPQESPDSSLAHMFGTLLEAEGAPTPRSGFDLVNGELDGSRLEAAVRAAHAEDEPLLIAGTSFAFVHWLDARADETLELPPGSRVMETGGFKGRSREVPRDELRRAIATNFSIPEMYVVNQYGMTELGSQFYDSTLIDPKGPRRKLLPPWTRVRFMDPVTGSDVEPGETGLILIHDLANTGSVAAIQTADLGRANLDGTGTMLGFDVLGRATGAEARGCSIAADAMLGGDSGSATS